MSAEIINFSAMRVAHLLRQSGPANSAADFIAHMADVARDQRDASRVAFWLEVALLVRRGRLGRAVGA